MTDADDISETVQIEGETVPIPEEYIELLKTRGSEKLVLPQTASESTIAAHNTQYVYNRDYNNNQSKPRIEKYLMQRI